MPIFIDPETRQRVLHQESCTDITYLADQASEAVTHETIPVIGPWIDYTGSGGNYSREQQMWGGGENRFAGTDAGLEGARLGNLGTVGQRTGTTRRRQRLIYRDLKKK